MKKALIITLLILPTVALAAPFTKDSYIATDATATSSFAGNFSVAGQTQFGGLGTGLLSIVNGLLSVPIIQSPLTFINNTLSISAAGSDGQVQFNDGGAIAADEHFLWDKDSFSLVLSSADSDTFIQSGVDTITGERSRLTIKTGEPTRNTDDGAEVSIYGGDGGLVAGTGGFVNISAGSAQSENFDGGSVDIRAGRTGDGASNERSGGYISLWGGQGGGGSATGGFLSLKAGIGGLNAGEGGSVFIEGGPSGFGGTGGLIVFKPGLAMEGGVSGTVQFMRPESDIRAIWNTSALSSDKIFTLPDFSGTFGLLEANQTWSGSNIFSKGSSATTTVNFGKIGDVTSHSCFNTKNTNGNDISFYFVGTTMVIENNTCQ